MSRLSYFIANENKLYIGSWIARIEAAPIEINTHYLDADLKILTGLIEPHFNCGCAEGLGSVEFCTIMRTYRTAGDFDNHHSNPENFDIYQW